MEAVKTEYATLQNMMSNGASGNEIVNQFEKVNSVLKETQNSLKQTKAEYSLLATEYQRLTLANYIEEWNQKNTAATREVIAQNEIYISSLRDLDVAMTKVEHNNIATSFKQTENSMRALNKLGASFSNQLRQAIDSFKVWVSATTVVMGAVTGVIELATYSDKLADSAQSLGNDFKDSENDISDYKDRIQELNDKINDSSTPYADVIQARKDLMTIQNEMIEKYGDEKGAIEDITNAIKGQADAFNNLNMTQYNKMVNDFNKTGGIVGKIQNAFVGSNFEQMKKDEKSYSDKIDMSYNSELDNYIKSLGAKQVISDRGSYFELNGALEEVYEKMQSIQEVANQLGEDKYANRLSDQINDAQELTDKYKDIL